MEEIYCLKTDSVRHFLFLDLITFFYEHIGKIKDIKVHLDNSVQYDLHRLIYYC